MENDPFVRLDSLYAGAIQRQEFQQAVQVLAQAASLACTRGRTEDGRRYFRDAIELAGKHDLERLELEQRVQRFGLLVNWDLGGRVRDELQAELTWELLPTGGAELRGELINQLDRYSNAALAAYDALEASQDNAAQPLRPLLELAREKALAFSLLVIAGQVGDAIDEPDNERILAAAASARSETVAICTSLRVQLFLLAADFEDRRGGLDTRDDLLATAELIAQPFPARLVNVYTARANYCEGDEAIAWARRAVEASERVPFAALKNQAAGLLNSLLARANAQGTPEATAGGAGSTELVMDILNGAAGQALADRRFEDALRHIGTALGHASAPHLRRAVLRMRAIALYELDRRQESEVDVDECISLLARELADAAKYGEFDNRIGEEESLYLMKAFLRARAGQSAEAWEAAEQGRSGRLKREIDGSPDFRADFKALHEWLHARRAAMVSFGSTRWGTLALTTGPDDAEPQSRILEFVARDSRKNRVPDADEDQDIRDAIPKLSAALIHPLLTRLREITNSAQVLYIVPDSSLYSAPFAGLTVEDSPESAMLIDLCALAIAPSAAVLLWCASRAIPPGQRNCLAVATGESQSVEFCDDLPVIASARWATPPTELAGEAATATRVIDAAPQHSVLYFSCHGTIARDTYEVMAASQLQLAAGSRLSAREVSGWKIQADLVFLNACLAGRFRRETRTDVTGFVKAFMLAGARSLIAPLIRVEPLMARDVSGWFFEAWLGGANKAEALRTAQFRAREKYADKGWATFWLFWDFI